MKKVEIDSYKHEDERMNYIDNFSRYIKIKEKREKGGPSVQKCIDICDICINMLETDMVHLELKEYPLQKLKEYFDTLSFFFFCSNNSFSIELLVYVFLNFLIFSSCDKILIFLVFFDKCF